MLLLKSANSACKNRREFIAGEIPDHLVRISSSHFQP